MSTPGKARVTPRELNLYGALQEVKQALKADEAYIIVKEKAMRVLKVQIFAKCSECDKMHPLDELVHIPMDDKKKST